MARRIEDLEKSMKRSNDKQLKIEHELCLKVYLCNLLFHSNSFIFVFICKLECNFFYNRLLYNAYWVIVKRYFMMVVYGFLQIKAWLEEGKDVRLGEWKAADIEILNTFQLLTAKPVVYLVSFAFW